MRIEMYFAIAFVFVTITAGAVGAKTITVSDSGAADYKSIQEAVNHTSEGDTILVYSGTYIENIEINKKLTIVSHSGNMDDTIVLAADSNDHIFHVTANNVIISGFNLTGANSTIKNSETSGIYLDGVHDCIITDNKLSNNTVGVFLDESSNSTLSNNIASDNSIGIFLIRSSNNTLNSNTVSNNTYCIVLDYYSNNVLSNNNASNNNHGIMFYYYSDNNALIANTANSNNDHGIYLNESSNNMLEGNIANSNSGHGIYLKSSINNTLKNNTANSNTFYGIFLDPSKNKTVNTDIITADFKYCKFLGDSSNNNTISDNHLTDNEIGIVANYSENQIYDNYINDMSPPHVPFIAPVLTLIILGMVSIFLKRK